MPHDRKPFLAACVQMRSGVDRRRNVEAASALIGEAAGKGAKFVATPEVTNVVDRNVERMLACLPEEAGLEEIGAFQSLAAKYRIWLLIGSMAVKLGARRAANRSYLFSPEGAIAARYDKLHMFDVQLPHGETWKESKMFEAGEVAVVAETPLAVFGLSICYDLRFPHLYRALARAGAEVLAIPAAFTKQTGEAHWRTLVRARAIECGAYVIAPSQGGRHEDGRDTYGHSMIVGPWGEIVAEAEGDEPGLIIGEIDPAKVAEARARIPNLALERLIPVTRSV
jgi:predicted amidohydrolase